MNFELLLKLETSKHILLENLWKMRAACKLIACSVCSFFGFGLVVVAVALDPRFNLMFNWIKLILWYARA